MIRRIRAHLTYANVMATLALFIALGGAGYAASEKFGSKDIRDNSVRSKDVRNNSLRGKDMRANTLSAREIRETGLSAVPRASTAGTADTLSGKSAEDLRVKCPAGTVLAAGACFETEPRAAALHNAAAETAAGAGRRLPTFRRTSRLLPGPAGTTSPPSGELDRPCLLRQFDGPARRRHDELDRRHHPSTQTRSGWRRIPIPLRGVRRELSDGGALSNQWRPLAIALLAAAIQPNAPSADAGQYSVNACTGGLQTILGSGRRLHLGRSSKCAFWAGANQPGFVHHGQYAQLAFSALRGQQSPD